MTGYLLYLFHIYFAFRRLTVIKKVSKHFVKPKFENKIHLPSLPTNSVSTEIN